MRRLLLSLLTIPLLFGITLSNPPTASAYEGQPVAFDDDIIDTDRDGKFDLSVCYGDNTSQGVYTGRTYLQDKLEAMFGFYVNVGDTDVAGRAYDDGFVSSGVCDDDGSSIWIHYFNNGTSTPIAQTNESKTTWSASLTAGLVQQCHIWLNSYYSYSWQSPTELNKVDGKAVVMHELGHCWGLNHSNIPDDSGLHNTIMHTRHGTHSPMNNSCSFFGDTMNLTSDDIAGFKDVYDGLWYTWLVSVFTDRNNGAPTACTD